MSIGTQKVKRREVMIPALPEAKGALLRILADLRARGTTGRQVTQERLINALWLWADDQPREKLLADLDRYVERVDRAWDQTTRARK